MAGNHGGHRTAETRYPPGCGQWLRLRGRRPHRRLPIATPTRGPRHQTSYPNMCLGTHVLPRGRQHGLRPALPTQIRNAARDYADRQHRLHPRPGHHRCGLPRDYRHRTLPIRPARTISALPGGPPHPRPQPVHCRTRTQRILRRSRHPAAPGSRHLCGRHLQRHPGAAANVGWYCARAAPGPRCGSVRRLLPPPGRPRFGAGCPLLACPGKSHRQGSSPHVCGHLRFSPHGSSNPGCGPGGQ